MRAGIQPERRPWRLLAAILLGVMLAALALAAHDARAESAGSQVRALQAGHLAAGGSHSCAILDDGQVRCWGTGDFGQLGYATTDTIGDDEAPESVDPLDLGPARTAAAVAAGGSHACAILDTGQVRCWGSGGSGRLGYGTPDIIGDDETPASAGPVDLGPGRTATAIAAGDAHTCAILDTGQVRCWGSGGLGRLGYGDTVDIGDNETPGSIDPVDLGSGRTATAISAGSFHTCAILDTGQVRCWGSGGDGRLGYGTPDTIGDNETPASVDPVDLGPGRTAVAVSAGSFHTCAILDTGQVRCWGSGDSGQLGYAGTEAIGDDETPASAGPVDLGPGRTAVAVSAGNLHTCAILDTGQVHCWGDGGSGRLGYADAATIGDDETPASAGAVDLGSGRTAAAISTGSAHTCAMLDTGQVRCWGLGTAGRLGYANTDTIGDDEGPAAAGSVELAGILAGRVASVTAALQSPTSDAQVGEQVAATATLTNAGPDPTLVRVTLQSPGFELLSGTPSAGAFSPATGLWTIDRLAPGQSATLDLGARVLAPGTRVLTARITYQSAVDPASFPVPAGTDAGAQVAFVVPQPPPVEVEVPGPTVTETVTVTVPAAVPPPPATPAFACTLPRRPSSLNLAATVGQLRINQRIAAAAVRRLNAIRARLEGRPAPAAGTGPRGTIRPTTGQLRINQRISEAAFARARAIFVQLGGTGAPTLAPRARTITLTRAGVGVNQLTNIRALDLLNCIDANLL